jgi:histidinol dehydrogenase
VRRVTLQGQITTELVRRELPRAEQNTSSVLEAVERICAEVKTESVAALKRHAEQFDKVVPKDFRVPASALASALEAQPKELRDALVEAIHRVRQVSRAGVPKPFSVLLAPESIVEQRYQPIDSVGLYVPGGKAVYPSSVIMNAVAAQEAGVTRIAICSPAQAEFDGLPHPSILAAAELLGIEEVYAIGGASAVAAFAYGISEIDLAPVEMVTGPGNIFVATAKRLLRGVIGIDSEAGPTEILILADSTADPRFVAADLISQAEHDENAAAVLVTDSSELIEQVQLEVDRQLPNAMNRERAGKALNSIQSALVLVESLQQGIAVTNAYATEHLEIMTQNDDAVLSQISNAGAIFLGAYSPVSLGDYLAGSNHVLPTGEQAKFGPGLGVHTFLRPQQVIRYGRSGLEKVARSLVRLADTEGLPAHGSAAEIRMEN